MEWFKNWFDSHYYHLLYQHRNQHEADEFTQNLLTFLNPAPASKILDLACGKGRHTKSIAKLGYEICGIDLSQNSIKEAIENKDENESFFVHDMRHPFRINYFDFVFNLFTSFGYFNNYRDELNTVKSIALGLKKDGVVVFDFFNALKVINMVTNEVHETTVEGVNFKWKKTIEDKSIVKNITVTDAENTFQFAERVRLLTQQDFEYYFTRCGLTLLHTFGNYQLQPFDVNVSDRLILIAKKNV